MQIRHINIVLLTAFIFCGCSSRYSRIDSMVKSLTVSEETFLTITNGSSLDAVKNKLGIAARHEFTIAETNGDYTLISCYFSGGDNDLWFLFRDKTLLKVIEPLTFPELLEIYPYQGTTASRTKSWDIDDAGIMGRVRRVVDAPALTHAQIVNDMRPYNGTGSEPLNILPALLLAGCVEEMSPRLEKDYEINEGLYRRYDGCRANLGMNAEDVEKLYGKPLRVFGRCTPKFDPP